MTMLNRPWGAHMSIAGGVDTALDRGASVGCRAIQMFTKNNNQWTGKPITDDDAKKFTEKVATLGVVPVASHDCYLINLASPDSANHAKSKAAFLDEIDRADQLGIPSLVFHPGAHLGEGVDVGIAKVIATLNEIMAERPDSQTVLTVETTAGQGSSLGWRFEEIAAIIDGVDDSSRMGVCVDTCHIFAAGYAIDTPEGYEETWAEFDRLIGVDKVRLFHVNDSKKGKGSRVDRHDHIGKGVMGVSAFRSLVNDPRFINTPMILETPKGKDLAEDRENLATLAGLLQGV